MATQEMTPRMAPVMVTLQLRCSELPYSKAACWKQGRVVWNGGSAPTDPPPQGWLAKTQCEDDDRQIHRDQERPGREAQGAPAICRRRDRHDGERGTKDLEVGTSLILSSGWAGFPALPVVRRWC